MAYKIVKCGDYQERRSFSKVKNKYELTNLLDVQKESYKWFIGEGMKEIFEELFPIDSFSGSLSVDFGDFTYDEPRYSINACKDRMLTYAMPLKVEARLFNHETGEVKEEKIFLGDIPIMTDGGSFIINGAERVIVSQLVRSPSAYYSKVIDKNGRPIITSQVIPNRGTWLEYETDSKDVIYVRIDRTRKVPVTMFLRALGLSTDEDIISLFGDSEYIQNTIAKDVTKNTDDALIEVYEKLRPGEPATLESSKNQLISRFFDELRYELGKVGRYKFNRKLSIADRLLNNIIAEDIIVDGKVIVAKDTLITREIMDEIKPIILEGYNTVEVKTNMDLDQVNKVQVISVYSKYDKNKVVKVVGNDPKADIKRITITDIYATVSYYMNLLEGIGNIDEIDHLGNRRVRQVGELLQNQFKVGISRMQRVVRERMTTQEVESLKPSKLINIHPITATMKEFFGSSQLSQFMDQINPIAELTHKRRLSALGPGGLSRDRAGMEVRDVNVSHYGRICPIESPEGPNIGLITSLASYAKIDEYGFILAPYRKVINGVVQDTIDYLTADEERDYLISQATINIDEKSNITDIEVTARYRGENIMVDSKKVNYIDVSPQQVVAITTSLIPFLEHDDATRALMGANMQRQAIPLLINDSPYIGTGVEYVAARDSGETVIAKADGVVSYVDSKLVKVKTVGGEDEYRIANYERSNQGNAYNQKPIVKVGQKVHRNMIIADGPNTSNGELALGKNVVVAFMTFNGYNYEDAIILNERLVKDDVYTSVHIEDYAIECRETKLGPEEVTRDIPNVGDEARKNLDRMGIVRIGTEVKEGDILVGKVTPKGVAELSSEEKLLHAIFGEKTREVRDTSLRVPHGADGIVHDVKIFTKENSEELSSGVSMKVRVYIVQKRKISVGDKMAGRHGNKGVISLILPQEDMPYLPDGRPIDIMLNPLGVPSRMNLGQILEIHLGMAAKKLGVRVETPVFDGAKIADIEEMVKEAGMDDDYKTVLYNGRTGEPFDNKVGVGVMYMIKLSHMVDDKLHARSTGPYSLVTQQPLGGKAQFGGQRFGEMEVWALYSYGAAHILQELLTVKSDDIMGRVKVYESIVKGENFNIAGVPESFRVLIKEFQALGLDVSIINDENKEIELKELEEDKEDENLLAEIEKFKAKKEKEEASTKDESYANRFMKYATYDELESNTEEPLETETEEESTLEVLDELDTLEETEEIGGEI